MVGCGGLWGGGDRNSEESQLQGEGRRDVSADGHRCRKQIQNLRHRGDRFSTREKTAKYRFRDQRCSAAEYNNYSSTVEGQQYCKIVTTAVRCESASTTTAVDLL